MCFTALQAQDIYKVESLSSEDLSGTARFVGMGGAMSALGADISTMSSNPAGIGLFRKGDGKTGVDVSMSGSVVVQPDARQFGGKGKVGGSFDQLGFVYSIEGDEMLSFFNVGFNYHRRNNAKRYMGALGIDLSQYADLTQAWQLADRAGFDPGSGEYYFLDLSNTENIDRDYVTPLSLLANDTYFIAPHADDGLNYNRYVPVNYAKAYDYERVNWGGVSQFDFNLSFNLKERIYGGLTFGVHRVNLNSCTDYSEWLVMPNLNDGMEHRYSMIAREQIHGSGFDVKAGVIVRPFEESAFLMGFSVSTPVFYDLTAEAYLEMNTPYEDEKTGEVDFAYQDIHTGRYDYKVRTPWKINVSMGTTVGRMLALGAEYELKNHRGSQVRYGYGDDYAEYPNSEKDIALCNEIDRFMKPTHTVRLGAEVRADKVYMRAGYNFVSAPFKAEAYLNQFLMSESYFDQVNTDYVNLGAIHRATCGFGYRGKRFYGDVAYQYQTQSADLYAFHVPVNEHTETNSLDKVSKNIERHNILFTLGYKF